MEKEKQLMAMAVTKALGYTENGGKPNPKKLRAGKSGELKSVFQLTPATWKRYAKEVLGDEKAPLTPDNETYVVSQKVSKWIDEGKNIRQIASIWNAGLYVPFVTCCIACANAACPGIPKVESNACTFGSFGPEVRAICTACCTAFIS